MHEKGVCTKGVGKRVPDSIELIDRIEVKVWPYPTQHRVASSTPLYHILQYLAMYICVYIHTNTAYPSTYCITMTKLRDE